MRAIATLLAWLAVPIAAQVELDPAVLTSQRIAGLPWKNTGQREQIIMYGDPNGTGLYAAALKWPPGTGTRPHTHPNDRLVMVVAGTWWVGTGTDYDMAKTVPMRAGTFVKHTAGQPHFDGAKDEEVLIYVTGQGPGTTHYLDQK